MRLTDVRIYPVKGLRGRTVSSASVEPWGLAGDRRWMVVDQDGRFMSQRRWSGMALITALDEPWGLTLIGSDGLSLSVGTPAPEVPFEEVTVWNDRVPAQPAAPEAHRFLSDTLGHPARLVYLTDVRVRRVDPAYGQPEDRVSFADGFPLLVTTEASLADLNRRLPAPMSMDRFRTNLVVTGSEAWDEDRWRLLRVGEVLFAAVKPCARCAVTTVDQETGLRSPETEPIRTLQRFRRNEQGKVLFGQNLIPRSLGTVRIGDPVEILA